MKTIASSLPYLLVTLIAAALAATGVLASGQSLDVTALSAIGFAASVAGWTFAQYRYEPRSFQPALPVRCAARRNCSGPEVCIALPQTA